MSHDDFAFEPKPGLPAPLPPGEELLWQGTPDWKSLAIRAYHVRKVAWYFGALMLLSVIVGVVNQHAVRDVLVSCGVLLVLGIAAAAMLAALAYFASRSTVYTVTSRRLLMRHGIAVPMTMNVPFKLIDGAAVKFFADGTGDIAVSVPKNQRVGYLVTWPHLRPGHITRPEPSFRALADAKQAADILSAALAADAGMSVAAPATLSTPVRTAEPWTPEPRAAEPRTPVSQPAGARGLVRPAAAA